jgi:hypothetical protein
MGLALDGGGDASCLGGAQGYPACLGVDGEAAPHQPAGPPKRREVRERGEEKERKGKGEGDDVASDMWGLRGFHADSAATSDKTRVKTTEGPKINGFIS